MHKTQTTDDIGIAANNSNEVTDCSQNRSKSPFIQFFVSFWARVKFLFTTTLAEACDCSSHSKGKSSYGDSCSVKGEDDIEVCVDLLDSAYVFNPTVATVFDQEPLELLKTAQPTKDVGVQRCEEVVDKPVVEAAVCTLLRESSHRLENFYTTLDDTDATEPIAEMHLEPVEQSNVSRFSNAVAFAQPIMLASLKPQAHFPELLLVVEKSNFFDFPTVFEEDEGEFGLENDFPGESLCSSLEIPNNSGNIHPVTVLGRLHSKLRNGDITTAEYNTRADSLIASTIPRNLSDSEVTRKPHGANQLYAWQLPPPLPESTGDEVTPPRDKQVTDVSDTSTFIDSVISDAVMEVSDSFDKEKKHIPPFLNLIDRSSRAEEDSFYLNLPCPADVSYDGLQTASLGRIRSTCTSHSSCKIRSSRSSSLKSERSPDETPCRKIVRFADSLGLDLATVRQVKDADNPPLIPASATLDLNLDTEKSFSTLGAKQFQICFPQPGASANFMHRVLNSFVCLENARVDSSRGLLTGTIRVKSVGFEKKVALRITYNNWATYFEVPASYVQDSHDGSTDRFSFSAVFPSTMVANERAQFAVRYETHSGDIYWDNNHGENYQIHCYAKATDIAGDGSWIHYL